MSTPSETGGTGGMKGGVMLGSRALEANLCTKHCAGVDTPSVHELPNGKGKGKGEGVAGLCFAMFFSSDSRKL